VEKASVSRECPIVLLVDDHEDSAAMYAIGLLAMGFQPVTSDTAEDAFARACQLRPDVVVADVTLTGSSGVGLLRRLRSDQRTHNAGIIVLTGHDDRSTRQEVSHAGCDRFLLKPCLPDVLALEIRAVLNQRRIARPAAEA
jgi:DNA-binding response OmpR family regulator